MGGQLSKQDMEELCQTQLQIFPGSEATEKPIYQFGDIKDIEVRIKKAAEEGVLGKGLTAIYKKMVQALQSDDLAKEVKASSRVLGAALGPCGVILMFVVEEIDKVDEVKQDDAWVQKIASNVCRSILAESCTHENKAVMMTVLNDLATFVDVSSEERKLALTNAHGHLEIHADTLARTIQEYTDIQHFKLFPRWCASAKLHITVAEELARNSSQWKDRRDGIICNYKAKFNYLAEAFMRQRVFAIVGGYSHAHPNRPTYDSLGEGKYGTTLKEISEQIDHGEIGKPWGFCRRWMRSKVMEMLVPQAEDFNRDLNTRQCTDMMLRFVPDSEIDAMYGPFKNLFKGNWTTTAVDEEAPVHLTESPFS